MNEQTRQPTVRIATFVGARPQFIKAAAVSRALAACNRHAPAEAPRLAERIIHTGQHYDRNMSGVFFEELGIPAPAANLGVGSGPHGRQTGRMLERIEVDLLTDRPDWVLLYGDTNSTLAGALAAAKLGIPAAHVEAGLRSGQMDMPEEINRIVADRFSRLRFCPTDEAAGNLAAEGIADGVHVVGDVMRDALNHHLALAEPLGDVAGRFGLAEGEFYLATVHRAENTDDPDRLASILSALGGLDRPVLLPVHPRTRATLESRGQWPPEGIVLTEPVGPLEILTLTRQSRLVLTDSGGLQKEAYWLGRPCVIFRDRTEWVELVSCGWARPADAEPAAIAAAVAGFESPAGSGERTPGGDLYGDGRASQRIVAFLAGG